MDDTWNPCTDCFDGTGILRRLAVRQQMFYIQIDRSTLISRSPERRYPIRRNSHAERPWPRIRDWKRIYDELGFWHGEHARIGSQPIQSLRHGVHLVIISAVRK